MSSRIVGLNIVVVFLFLADRFLKLFFQKNPAVSYGGDFFSGFLSFNFYTNTGVAFGLKLNQQFLMLLILVILIFLAWLLVKEYKRKNLLAIFSLTLILTGALSNMLDRVRFGYVIDYIDVKWFTVFNLADAMITIGVFIFGLIVFLDKDLDNKSKIG